jgi:phospholipid transport system substrate-binding protein
MLERNMVTIKDQKQRDNKAFVQTDVTYKGDTFGLDYKLIDRSGTWKVYDVIIENIGLVANYRNEFAGIMRKEKFSGLLSKLEKKVDEPAAS